MPAPKLTPKQRRLKNEIEDIAALVQMDHWNILDYSVESRTTYLEIMKRQLVRGEIITKYTLIDEFLSVLICHFYFKKPNKGVSFRALWKTKKFQLFNHFVLDETYLLNKMKLVSAVSEIPPDVRRAVERINAVRNAIAHSFFPENRRQYIPYRRVMYQNADIYSKPGIEQFG